MEEQAKDWKAAKWAGTQLVARERAETAEPGEGMVFEAARVRRARRVEVKGPASGAGQAGMVGREAATRQVKPL